MQKESSVYGKTSRGELYLLAKHIYLTHIHSPYNQIDLEGSFNGSSQKDEDMIKIAEDQNLFDHNQHFKGNVSTTRRH